MRESAEINAMNESIENAIQTLGVDMLIVSVGDLDRIAKASGCDTFDVMWYIRYDRRHFLRGERYR